MHASNVLQDPQGRIVSFLKDGKLNLGDVRVFILDEADRLLDTGNKEDIMSIYKRLPTQSGPGVQVSLFSATLHSDVITELAEQITRHATWVDLKGKDAVPETVDHAIIRIDPATDTSWHKATRYVHTSPTSFSVSPDAAAGTTLVFFWPIS